MSTGDVFYSRHLLSIGRVRRLKRPDGDVAPPLMFQRESGNLMIKVARLVEGVLPVARR